MDIIISNGSQVPIYQQIYEQVSQQIANGKLSGNSALPPIRTIALELGISVITIKKAWEELERSGFIYTVAGKGCFVAPVHPRELALKRDKLVHDKLESDLRFYASLGLSPKDVAERIIEWFDD